MGYYGCKIPSENKEKCYSGGLQMQGGIVHDKTTEREKKAVAHPRKYSPQAARLQMGVREGFSSSKSLQILEMMVT